MLKYVKIYLLPLMVVAGIIGVLFLAIQPDIVINEYKADIVIDDQGDMHVTETWDMTYGGDYNVRFRDIGFGKYPDNYPFTIDSSNYAEFIPESASVRTFKDRMEVTSTVREGYSFNGDYDELFQRIKCEPVSSECESIFTDFTATGGLNGVIRFVYTYEIAGAVTEHSDISELNWTLFEYAEGKVEKGSIHITLPVNTNDENDYSLFSHQIKNTSTEIVSNNEFEINFTNMKSRDALAFRLLIPRNVFPNIRENNVVFSNSFNEQVILDFEANTIARMEKEQMIETAFLFIPVIGAMLMIIVAYFLKMTIFSAPKVSVEDSYYKPPTDHSPAQIGYLINNKKFKSEIFTATLLDLVRRGYIDIDDDQFDPSDNDLVFVKKEDIDINELSPHERFLVTWIFSEQIAGDKVSTHDLVVYATNPAYSPLFISRYNEFVEKVTHEGMRADFFNLKLKNRIGIALLFNIIPIAIFIASFYIQMEYDVNIILGYILPIITIGLYSFYVTRRTLLNKNGKETLEKWQKYKEYLLNTENLTSVSFADVDYLDKALVFATVFDIAEEVMEQINITPVSDVPMEGSRVYYRSHRYYHHHHYSLTRRLNKNITTSMRFANGNVLAARAAASRAAGRSSGRSGGGSFGGGGGGGRSR